MTQQQILSDAAALIEQPGKWTQSASARDKNYSPVLPDDPTAVCWCASGALILIAGQEEGEKLSVEVGDFLNRNLNIAGIFSYNDTEFRTAGEVARVFRQVALSLDTNHG